MTAHNVRRMIALEYQKGRSVRWHVAWRMHEAGRANMERDAPETAEAEGWSHWRITTEEIDLPPSDAWARPHSAGFKTELTPAGEQAVIPGCERNLAPAVRQLDLFG